MANAVGSLDYSLKLKTDRNRKSEKIGRDFNEEMESDRGRAINSAAVRRLQQKTQVFPLEANAAVRSRLTHSLEVQQVGRYIAKLILKKLKASGCDLSEYSDGLVSAVEVSCLLHDIGNPPFGHFGEEAINLWTESFLRPFFEKKYGGLSDCHKLVEDLCHFEGNAQGLRILHQSQNMNLTFTQLACLIKYTRAAYEPKPKEKSYLKKKPGFYFSEQDVYQQLRETLSIAEGSRFPLTYIMEAADDISYCLADVEDAVDKGILSLEKLHSEIQAIWNDFKGENKTLDAVVDEGYLLNIADKANLKAQAETYNKSHAYILTLRTILVNDLAEYAATRYVDNHQAVFDGTFDQPLLKGNDQFYLATETLRNLAIKNVFNHPEVENLELKGFSIIKGLLGIYEFLMYLSFSEFKDMWNNNGIRSKAVETRLYHKISRKNKTAYHVAVKSLFDKADIGADDELLELYYRARMLIDYVSGMTDGFALEEYRNLTAAI